MLKVYIDASTKGNPGPSGGGILIVYQGKQEQLSIPLSIGTNHQAEFEVFLKTLEFLKKNDLQNETIFCFSDSKTLVSTVDKNATKNELFLPYLQRIQELLSEFSLLILHWIQVTDKFHIQRLFKVFFYQINNLMSHIQIH